MGMWIGRGRKARIAYGFDDIALVPGAVTVNSNEVDIAWELCGRRFDIPIIAAAMDGVVGPRLAAEMGRLGGLAVLNLERSEEHTSELQSQSNLVCRLLLEKKKKKNKYTTCRYDMQGYVCS